jgi:hypothetical protein
VGDTNDPETSISFREPRNSGSPASQAYFDMFSIANAGISTREKLMGYVKYHYIAEVTLARSRILSALAPYIDPSESSTGNIKFRQALELNNKHLIWAECRKKTYRDECWDAGHDLDKLNQALKADVPRYEISDIAFLEAGAEPAVNQQHKGWWDVLRHVGAKNWITKKDRINSWLLQNLAAQPSEALHHRRFLQDQGVDCDKLSEEEWARLVLKSWTLDDAARPEELADCSTNGAVDSDGACHSARVKLSEFLPLPIREKERGSQLDAVEMDIDSESDAEAETIELSLERPRKRKRDMD